MRLAKGLKRTLVCWIAAALLSANMGMPVYADEAEVKEAVKGEDAAKEVFIEKESAEERYRKDIQADGIDAAGEDEDASNKSVKEKSTESIGPEEEIERTVTVSGDAAGANSSSQNSTIKAVRDDNDLPQAIWTKGNTTLTFIYGPACTSGDTFNGEAVTEVWIVRDTPASEEGPEWVSSANPELTKIVFDESFAKVKPESTSRWFYGCYNLSDIDLTGLDTSNVTDMSGMFCTSADEYSSLTSIDLSGLDLSNVKDMSDMFSGCSSLTSIDLSGLDLSNVTEMDGMFAACRSLTSIGLSGLDLSSVTDMSWMFSSCSSLTNIDLSGLGLSKMESMAGLFSDCENLTSINLEDIDTSEVTDMSEMFWGCFNLTGIDLSGLNTSNVTDMSGMFGCCESLTSIDLSSLNTSSVTYMTEMFGGCSGLTGIDLSSLDTSEVIYMTSMFGGCSGLTSIDLNCLNTSKVTNMGWMFEQCSSLTSIDMGSLDTTSLEYMPGMFGGCSSLTSIDLSSLETSKVTDMFWMFDNCSSLTDINLRGLDLSGVTDMTGMFSGCSSLANIDLSGLDLSGVTEASSMFNNCSSLTSIDLSRMDLSNATYLQDMFNDCRSLKTIFCADSETDWSAVRYSTGMFTSCYSPIGTDGDVRIPYDSGHTDASMAKAASLGGYFTPKPEETSSAQIVAASVNFKGSIGLNYYIDIPVEYLAVSGAYIEYTLDKLTPETARVMISELPTAAVQGRECRKLTVDTVVKSIGDKITLHIYDGEGNKLGLLSARGEDITEEGFVYSVGQYCDDVEEQSTNASMKDLAFKLKQYGLYVQKYLDYKADEAQPTLDVSGVTAETLEPFKGHRTDAVEGLTFAGFSFLFKEESAVRHRFRLSEGRSIDEYTFRVDGTEVTPAQNGSQYVIEIGNMRARDLGKEYPVEITDQDGNTQILSYSGLSYAKALIEQGSTEEARNAAKALYLYYDAAIKYFET